MKHACYLTLVVGAIMLAVPFAAICVSESPSEAAAGTEEDPILLLRGDTWVYETDFPSGLDVTVTVSASPSATPSDDATFDTSSGYATVTGKLVEVTIPTTGVQDGLYYLKIKATSTKPTQVAYQTAVFLIQPNVTATGGTVYAAEGGAFDPFSVVASVPSTYSISDYGTLDASKVAIDPDTGAVTVTASNGDAGTHSIKVMVRAMDNPSNATVVTLSIEIAKQIEFTSAVSAGFVVAGA